MPTVLPGLPADSEITDFRVAAAARHEHLGQLNTYVTWFQAHERTEGDNPPIGILLCTRKNHALVEYALAGMDSRLFVSQYQLELPEKDEIRRFLEEQMTEVARPPDGVTHDAQRLGDGD